MRTAIWLGVLALGIALLAASAVRLVERHNHAIEMAEYQQCVKSMSDVWMRPSSDGTFTESFPAAPPACRELPPREERQAMLYGMDHPYEPTLL